MKKTIKITVAGNLIVDKIKLIDVYPTPTMLCTISALGQGIGGCAANTAAALRCLSPDLPTACIGLTGQDPDGLWLKETLAGFGVDVSGIRQELNTTTSFTDVFTVKSTGERTFFHSRGANSLFDLSHIDIEALDCSIFHTGYALLLDCLDSKDEQYGTRMARLLAMVREKKIKTSLDLVSETGDRFQEVVTPSLPYCDYLIINETEAGQLAGLSPRRPDNSLDGTALKKICGMIFDKGVKECIIIHAPEASCAMKKDGSFLILGSLILPDGFIKGSVGAGDTFCAASLICLAEGRDLLYTLQAASCAAACNLTEANSTDGLIPLSEAVKRYETYARYPV